jgi:hypothetical protein
MRRIMRPDAGVTDLAKRPGGPLTDRRESHALKRGSISLHSVSPR